MEIERAWPKQVTKIFEKKNIFNFDETDIFWKIMHGCSIVPVDYNLEGLKQEKIRMTIVLYCNSDGSEKLKPVIIAHLKRPRRFGKFKTQTISLYFSNQKAWMNMFIFPDWLKQLHSKIYDTQ